MELLTRRFVQIAPLTESSVVTHRSQSVSNLRHQMRAVRIEKFLVAYLSRSYLLQSKKKIGIEMVFIIVDKKTIRII